LIRKESVQFAIDMERMNLTHVYDMRELTRALPDAFHLYYFVPYRRTMIDKIFRRQRYSPYVLFDTRRFFTKENVNINTFFADDDIDLSIKSRYVISIKGIDAFYLQLKNIVRSKHRVTAMEELKKLNFEPFD